MLVRNRRQGRNCERKALVLRPSAKINVFPAISVEFLIQKTNFVENRPTNQHADETEVVFGLLNGLPRADHAVRYTVHLGGEDAEVGPKGENALKSLQSAILCHLAVVV